MEIPPLHGPPALVQFKVHHRTMAAWRQESGNSGANKKAGRMVRPLCISLS
jgi:hypothetical protein